MPCQIAGMEPDVFTAASGVGDTWSQMMRFSRLGVIVLILSTRFDRGQLLVIITASWPVRTWSTDRRPIRTASSRRPRTFSGRQCHATLTADTSRARRLSYSLPVRSIPNSSAIVRTRRMAEEAIAEYKKALAASITERSEFVTKRSASLLENLQKNRRAG